MSDFRLKYGLREIELITNRGHEPVFLSPHVKETGQEAARIINNALKNPLGSPALGEIVSRGEKIAIIASDITRATGSHIFLPIIVEELNAAGIADDDIDIIIATGIHRKQTEEEHRRLLGDSLCRRIRPTDHDARDKSKLVSYGKTSRGTEVAVNRTVAEADKIVLTGAVSPHYFAGFGGGRKSIMPGVCSIEAALQNHLLVFNAAPTHGRNPDVRIARLAGNPLHEDMLEAAEIVNPDFMLNTMVARDREILSAFAGNYKTAHEAACAFYMENFSVVVPRRADLTIVSCGGYPKDINFIQAHKAIHSAFSVTRPGGWMIVLAECRDGFGYPGFIDWFKFGNITELERKLRAGYHIYGQTAYSTLEKSTTVNIVFVSELDASDLKRMRIRPAASFEEAYRMATGSLERDFTTHVIPAASSALLLTANDHRIAMASISGDYESE